MKFKSFETGPACSCMIRNLAIPSVFSSVCTAFILEYIYEVVNYVFLNRCIFPLAIKLCPNIVCAVKNRLFPSNWLENTTNEERKFSSSSLPILYIPSGFLLQDFSAQLYLLFQRATPISYNKPSAQCISKIRATTSQQHQHLLIGDGVSGRYCQPVIASYLLSL